MPASDALASARNFSVNPATVCIKAMRVMSTDILKHSPTGWSRSGRQSRLATSVFGHKMKIMYTTIVSRRSL